MTQETIRFAGVHRLAPEEFYCLLFTWTGHDRILPVWVSPIDGARIEARLAGYEHRRPDTYALLLDVLERSGGVEAITITHAHEGVFMADVSTPGDEEGLDARVSDALVIAAHFDVPITADADLLQEQSVYASAEDLQEYFGLEIEPEVSGGADDERSAGGGAHLDRDSVETEEGAQGTADSDSSASGDAQADADFSELLCSLGLTEDELDVGLDSDPDSNAGHDDPSVTDVNDDAEGDDGEENDSR